MGIDVRQFCRTVYGSDDAYHRELAAEHVALIRTVIADEAAKAAPAASPASDEPPQCAEGVPEWVAKKCEISGNADSPIDPWVYLLEEIENGWNTDHPDGDFSKKIVESAQRLYRTVRVIAEAEIARSVAEAEDQAARYRLFHRRDCHEIRRLTTERDAARAEVERLKEKVATDKAVNEGVDDRQRALCEQKDKRIADLEAHVADQCKEIERMSRPAERESDVVVCASAWPSYKGTVAVEDYRVERNAREAAEQRAKLADERAEKFAKLADKAEASLAELRELMRTRYLDTRTGTGRFNFRHHEVTERQFAEALEEFRKTREPAK